MKRYKLRTMLVLMLSLSMGVVTVAQEPIGRTHYTQKEIGDLLLEGMWYDVYSYRLALNDGESELSSWLFVSIRRNMVLAVMSKASAEDLSAQSLEVVCLVTEDEQLLNRLKSKPGGRLISEWLTVSEEPIRYRIRYLQASYGGGTGCSVTNENGDVYDTVIM